MSFKRSSACRLASLSSGDRQQQDAAAEVHHAASALHQLVGQSGQILLGGQLGAEVQQSLLIVIGVMVDIFVDQPLDELLHIAIRDGDNEHKETEDDYATGSLSANSFGTKAVKAATARAKASKTPNPIRT